MDCHDQDVELLIQECREELRRETSQGAQREALPEAFARLADLIEARLRARAGRVQPHGRGT